jgi:hypothetical protein
MRTADVADCFMVVETRPRYDGPRRVEASSELAVPTLRVVDQGRLDALGRRHGSNALDSAGHHAREDAAPRRQHAALVNEAVADGIKGQEAHPSLKGSAQDQRRAARVDGAHAVGARYLSNGSERVPGATPAALQLRPRLCELEGVRHGRLDAARDSACEQGDARRWSVLLLRRR